MKCFCGLLNSCLLFVEWLSFLKIEITWVPILVQNAFILQEGREVVKKKAFVPPPRFMNVDEARYC